MTREEMLARAAKNPALAKRFGSLPAVKPTNAKKARLPVGQSKDDPKVEARKLAIKKRLSAMGNTSRNTVNTDNDHDYS